VWLRACARARGRLTTSFDWRGVHQSGVSRHLRIPRKAGFVSMRPEGQRRLYSLRAEPFCELEAWLAPYRRLWAARLDRCGLARQQQQKASWHEKPGETDMSDSRSTAPMRAPVVIERTYRARAEELWETFTPALSLLVDCACDSGGRPSFRGLVGGWRRHDAARCPSLQQAVRLACRQIRRVLATATLPLAPGDPLGRLVIARARAQSIGMLLR